MFEQTLTSAAAAAITTTENAHTLASVLTQACTAILKSERAKSTQIPTSNNNCSTDTEDNTTSGATYETSKPSSENAVLQLTRHLYRAAWTSPLGHTGVTDSSITADISHASDDNDTDTTATKIDGGTNTENTANNAGIEAVTAAIALPQEAQLLFLADLTAAIPLDILHENISEFQRIASHVQGWLAQSSAKSACVGPLMRMFGRHLQYMCDTGNDDAASAALAGLLQSLVYRSVFP